ncbi:hypothetical protein AJ87_26340 [Rhizobium yanglingense]|nr:hypothetical protein AJ87_26340 [Rhizobium yanglingense]
MRQRNSRPEHPRAADHVSDEERIANGKELHDLGVHQCRWPLNNGSPFLFCADATGGELYCGHHMNRAHRPKGSE